MKDFAKIWREMPKIVFSRTMEDAGWNTTIEREVNVEEIKRLKGQPGGDMVIGGAHLAATFLRENLIDEYRIYVHPVVIGEGTPLFPPAETRIALRLEETHTFASGVVLLRYSVI